MSNPVVPQHCPTQRELDDLELLTVGALAPLTGFGEPGSPVTLTLPDELAVHDVVELVDPEGLPLARVTARGDGAWSVEQLTPAQHGPFRRLHLSPADARREYAGRTFVPVSDALTDADLDHLGAQGPLVLLALTGHGTPQLSPVALVRATLAAARTLDAEVIAVPLASHDDAEVDHTLGAQVLATYAGGDPVVGVIGDGELVGEIAEIVAADRPGPEQQGLVVFFTGLSGSGKSTLAQALMDRLLEQGERSVTSLDGDVVRRHLSAGLTFSREDRETNIRRIGWVAAEISRHGGVAVCSPIAPFDETRQQVRRMVDDAGGACYLVHVATPLEECERRDRKGLYAKARRGEIPEFTGISSPYEEPQDADLRVDTTGRTIDDALADVLAGLSEAGYAELSVATPDPAPVVAAPHRTGGNPEPIRVLFVCTANICRSPYMELTARHLLGDTASVQVSSAGTHGFHERAMDTPMARALERRDIASDSFSSQRLTPHLVAEADLVLTAETSHRQFILDDLPGGFGKVLTLGQLKQTLRALPDDLSGRELLRMLVARRGPADVADDVPDPYGRGPKAAEQCATQIDGLLRAVIPALAGSDRMA